MKPKTLLLMVAGLLPASIYAQQVPGAPAPATTEPTKPAPAADAPATVSAVLSKEEAQLIENFRKNTIVLPKAKTTTFKVTVLNTNFIVPVVRFNALTSDPTSNQKGNISLFNSIGAGVSLNAGRLELTTDDDGEVINRELHNTAGVQLGFLFAANAGSANNVNIFAPTVSFMLLNFNLGVGYEFGSVAANEDRVFYTLAYGIPLSKLVQGGYFVWKKEELPTNTRNGFY